MKASLKAYALAKGYEGWSAAPYLCPGGQWTIGWGHTLGVTAHTPAITEAQGELYLAHDIIEAEAIVNRAVTVLLNQNEFDALVLFVMNIGPGQAGVKSGLAELKTGGPSTLLRRLNENDRAGAAAEWLKWVYAGGQQLAGLVKRRAEERALFLTPVTVPIPAAASPGIATPAAGGASAWQRIAALWAVLRRGRELAGAETWKSRQAAASALTAILGALAPFLPIEVSNEDLLAIAGGVAAVGGLLNAYLVLATSRRVGVPAGGEPAHDSAG